MLNNKISFHFHPYDFENKNHAVEKTEGDGQKRRYLEGIASGVKTDQHGERMTDKCIKSFMEQANSGDILLYPDVHGIRASEDIGILKEAKVLPGGDWWISSKLHDGKDGIGSHKSEIIETLWKQQCGLPPYTKPKQKGFSIEGLMPEGSILGGETDQAGNIKKRIIDNVVLDGVVLVPRPAYKDSISSAVYKALGELPPDFEKNVRKSVKEELQQKIKEEELRNKYYDKKWDVNDALESQIEKVMRRENDNRKEEQLRLIFEEYSTIMLKLIMESEELFVEDEDSEDTAYGDTPIRKNAKIVLFQSMYNQLAQIEKSLNQRRINNA